MQTFLPHADFRASAACLDRQRLGKQRVECWQLLRAITVGGSGWSNHPAARMWSGFEASLVEYAVAVCLEWRSRGYRDTMLDRFRGLGHGPAEKHPGWLGDEAFHLSHRSNLVRKLPGHYGPMFPGVPDDLPYVWPA